MEHNLLITRLHQNAGAIESLAGGISDEQARWKPDPDSWSLLEVVHHLYDEEKYDFRVRLGIILSQSGESWPPIDPAGWVIERTYNEQDLSEILGGFIYEREKSLRWLNKLESPDWTAVYQAPWGPITAGDMFVSWVAHDMLHLRQLIELHWAYNNKLVTPYKVEYAGAW